MNEVYILVKEFDLNEGIKGFFVRHKDDLIAQEIESRQSTVTYSYGSWGTIGVSVTYVSEPYSRCRNFHKLSQRKWRPLLLLPYSTLWTRTLYTSGTSASWSSCTEYKEYKLRISSRSWKCGAALSTYIWLTSCRFHLSKQTRWQFI